MTEEEFIDALVRAKDPAQVQDAFVQMADSTSDLMRKADHMESLRQAREVPPTPMDSGAFFQRLLQQGGGKVIPLK